MAKSKSGYCAAIDKLPWILRLIFSDILFFPFSLDDCLSFIFLQLKYPYISLKRKAEKPSDDRYAAQIRFCGERP